MSRIIHDATRVTATEHELLPGEVAQDIHRVIEIRYRSLTVVVLEGPAGEMFGGMSVFRAGDVAFVRARQNAWNQMHRRREQTAQYSMEEHR
jgi:hypothetical protein